MPPALRYVQTTASFAVGLRPCILQNDSICLCVLAVSSTHASAQMHAANHLQPATIVAGYSAWRTQRISHDYEGIGAYTSSRSLRLWLEHVAFTREFMEAALDRSHRTAAVEQRLLRNQAELAALIDARYPGSYEAVHKLLVQHITIAKRIVLARNKRDERARAMVEWERNGDEIADALATLKGATNSQPFRGHMKAHLDSLAAELLALEKGEAAIAEYDTVTDHIVALNEALAL